MKRRKIDQRSSVHGCIVSILSQSNCWYAFQLKTNDGLLPILIRGHLPFSNERLVRCFNYTLLVENGDLLQIQMMEPLPLSISLLCTLVGDRPSLRNKFRHLTMPELTRNKCFNKIKDTYPVFFHFPLYWKLFSAYGNVQVFSTALEKVQELLQQNPFDLCIHKHPTWGYASDCIAPFTAQERNAIDIVQHYFHKRDYRAQCPRLQASTLEQVKGVLVPYKDVVFTQERFNTEQDIIQTLGLQEHEQEQEEQEDDPNYSVQENEIIHSYIAHKVVVVTISNHTVIMLPLDFHIIKDAKKMNVRTFLTHLQTHGWDRVLLMDDIYNTGVEHNIFDLLYERAPTIKVSASTDMSIRENWTTPLENKKQKTKNKESKPRRIVMNRLDTDPEEQIQTIMQRIKGKETFQIICNDPLIARRINSFFYPTMRTNGFKVNDFVLVKNAVCQIKHIKDIPIGKQLFI